MMKNIKGRCNMTHLLLSMLVLGSVHSLALQNEVPPADGSEYTDYSDDEEGPAQQVQMSTETNPTIMPYFEDKEATMFAELNRTVKLECPVKNFIEQKHHLSWYKNGEIVTNGKQALKPNYSLSKNYSLIIKQATDETPGNYACIVSPINIRRTIILKIDDKRLESPPPTPGSTAQSSTSSCDSYQQSAAITIMLPTALLIFLNTRKSLPAK